MPGLLNIYFERMVLNCDGSVKISEVERSDVRSCQVEERTLNPGGILQEFEKKASCQKSCIR
jgi:hypothetical protein